jgi:hypothetical protein
MSGILGSANRREHISLMTKRFVVELKFLFKYLLIYHQVLFMLLNLIATDGKKKSEINTELSSVLSYCQVVL